MILHRPSASLTRGGPAWLDARLHFAFDGPGWGLIRIWNDDRFAPQSGFPLHPHRDVEIITVVLDGAITHADDLGNRSRVAAGSLQVMSAGVGVRHAEMNLEPEVTRLFQIWLQPDRLGVAPEWTTRSLDRQSPQGRMVVLASGFEADASPAPIRAQARLMGAALKEGESVRHDLTAEHSAYLVVVSGRVRIGVQTFEAGDGAAIVGEPVLHVTALEDAEVIAVETASRRDTMVQP